MSARPAAWLRVSAPRAEAVLVTASDVIRRAKSLAALAIGIDDNLRACAAHVPDLEFTAWVVEYVKDAAIVDPLTDPLLGIVINPWSAWSTLDEIEPVLRQWRAKANAWCGLAVPVPPPTPDPFNPGDLSGLGLDTSTKLLVGGAIVLGILVAWKL